MGSKKEGGSPIPKPFLTEPFSGSPLRALLLLCWLRALQGERLAQQQSQYSREQPATSGLRAGTGFELGLGGESIIRYILSRYLSTHQYGPA